MAIYQTRNCIRATQWDPEDKQSLENIKALVKENPRLGWRVDDNILSNNVIIRKCCGFGRGERLKRLFPLVLLKNTTGETRRYTCFRE